MKKINALVLSFGLLALTQTSFAQKGKITSAQISLQEGKVIDAKKDIDAALQDADVQKRVDAWTTKGDVYKQIYETKLFYAQNPTCLFDAKDAYLKAFELETNPKKQKNLVAPMESLTGHLFNEGLSRFNAKKYDDAYKHFNASRELNDFLYTKGLVKTLDTNAIYATAMSGANLNKNAEIKPLLEKLIAMNYDNAAVYETLAQIYEIEKNKPALHKIVTEGLKRYPSSKNLSIFELNASLEGNDVQQSIDKFEKAYAAEPNNSSLAFNLGVLYDKAKNYDKAKEYYEKAIAIKPNYSDAFFNLGVMYFNEGVIKNKEMNAVDDAKDKDGKIYTGLKAQRDALFLLALPNLEKAYSLEPKNQDYKQNLKKVYASMNLLDKAKALGD